MINILAVARIAKIALEGVSYKLLNSSIAKLKCWRKLLKTEWGEGRGGGHILHQVLAGDKKRNTALLNVDAFHKIHLDLSCAIEKFFLRLFSAICDLRE